MASRCGLPHRRLSPRTRRRQVDYAYRQNQEADIDYRTHIAIVGGGVCGLWLLRALIAGGREAILLERDTLGGGQTLASQGMIHGGIKYALGGFTTPSSETIANMPSVWETYLAGKGAFDLSAVRVLSRDYYLFSDSSVSSRVTAFFGSKSIRGRVAKMPASEHPQPFSHAAFKGALYRLADIVVDTPSLVSELANGAPGRVLQADARAVRGSDGGVTHLQLQDGSTLSADCYIFAAGQGNGALIEAAGIDVV
ncbi:MAG: FAD-dependent oxidoreductase, partial [Pseudomonadales bacterium]|nr:FAD-dependent oxidoreductase [Pseudomonadales bacterium]